MKASWLTFWPLFKNISENSKRPLKKSPVFEKKVQKDLKQGQQPLFYLSASWSIFSGVAHLIYTKFKSYGWFYSSFNFMKKIWPLKASKAYKDHLSFCCLSLGNKNSLQSEYFIKNMHFLFLWNLSLVEFEGVCFTSAWPFWPLKANFFSSNNFFLQKNGVI